MPGAPINFVDGAIKRAPAGLMPREAFAKNQAYPVVRLELRRI